jgi:hypothetical protein
MLPYVGVHAPPLKPNVETRQRRPEHPAVRLVARRYGLQISTARTIAVHAFRLEGRL